MQRLTVAIGVFVVIAGLARRADACACCDARLTRLAVGWSASGKSLLVEHDKSTPCEARWAYEVWRVGAKAPDRCFDRLADPNKPVSCDELELGPVDAKPKASTQTRHFPKPAVVVDPSRVRVTMQGKRTKAHTIVEVADGDAWVVVWSSRKARVAPLHVHDGDKLSAQLVLAPSGTRAALLLRGHDTAPGTGRFPTDLYWVMLDAALADRLRAR